MPLNIDPNNPIVKLCIEGLRSEGVGRLNDARRLYEQAWRSSRDDFEACIAAHYLARQQHSEEDTLRWNREALDRADKADVSLVSEFYASLYLNMGHSYETLQAIAEARQCHELALKHVAALPNGAYAQTVRNGVERALARTELPGKSPPT